MEISICKIKLCEEDKICIDKIIDKIDNKIIKSIYYKNRPICPVYQYSLGGEFIQEWQSTTIAAEVLGLSLKCISNVCCGLTKEIGGFKWSKRRF